MTVKKSVAKKAPAAKKSVAKKTIEIRSADKKRLAGSRSIAGKLDTPKASPRAKKITENVSPEVMSRAYQLLDRYHASLAYYYPFNPDRRQPFRIDNEKTTKSYLRGNIFNNRGVKIGSYRKELSSNTPYASDELFRVSFVDKTSREAFESTLKSNYDEAGFSDPGSFFHHDFRVNSDSISRYMTFLYIKKYPKKVEDFIEQAKSLSDTDDLDKVEISEL